MVLPKISSAAFLLGVHRLDQLPAGGLFEVAFLGRSNVGKSSLINSLLGRRKLVRTSSRPGCTRALNFFLINHAWHFVDLPGFGYAAVSREAQAGWGKLVMGYLEERRQLAGVVFLQDGRRLPGDEELYLWERLTARGRRVIPVLTKADKVKKSERARRLKEVAEVLSPWGMAQQDFIWFSAVTREGRELLWNRLLDCLETVAPGPLAHP
ncbi:MAG: YihA family ribosome biogenesis GTP-binding protein [Deltaproteobacteria bacterium]|nr:YihA family ribosome biogenesis GTP-binding protein [Deltaproteobacteria bacterium]MBM4285772.1 YihA family ribosome biogenesis GTP-binding protein [Deltaproteobacteria bacterium]